PALTASIAVPSDSNVTAQQRPSGPNDVKPDACAGITLGGGNLLVLGGSGGDALSGGSGDDCIVAGGGDDTMHGGAGAAACIGGAGPNIAIDCETMINAPPLPEPLIAPASASLDGVDATTPTSCISAAEAPAETTVPPEPAPAPCEPAPAAPTE